MPATMSFRELMITHLVQGKLEVLHIHPVMLHDTFDLLFDEAKAITDELELMGESWFCTWSHDKRTGTSKEGIGIVVRRK